jgi:short-subunit dehydrogenase
VNPAGAVARHDRIVDMEIAETIALVTGASGGIGQAIARELAARGASVVLTGRRAGVLEPLAAELNGRAIVADLSDRDAAARLMDETGPVDILVANAALPASGPLTDYELDAVDRALDVNLRVPVVMARLAAEEMVSRRRGHLVFVSSVGGKVASGGASLYNATKFGLRGFSLALREDLRPHGVGVSAVYPGFVRDAGMFAESGVTLPRGMGTRTPGDVARAVARAIERDTAEVDVAPLSLRIGVRVAAVTPGLAARIQRLGGADRLTQALAEGQRDKR